MAYHEAENIDDGTEEKVGGGAILAIILLISYILIFFVWLAFEFRIKVKKAERIFTLERENKDHQLIRKGFFNKLYLRLRIFYYIITNSYLLFLLIYVSLLVLALRLSKIFFSILLLDIIERSPILQNVIKSIT